MKNTFCIEPATNGGTGPWALSLMTAVCKFHGKLSSEEICLLFQCLRTLSSSSYISIPAFDFWLYLFLEFGDDQEVCREGFVTLKNIVSKYHDINQLFSKKSLTDVLFCGENSKVLSDDEVFKCRSVLEHGINGVKIEETSFLFLPTMIKILKVK